MLADTAASFLGLGLAMLALARRRPGLAQLGALGAAAIAFARLVGHAYGHPSSQPFDPQGLAAPHTAIPLLTLTVGLLWARADEGLVRILTSATAGGVTARRLLPWAIGIPVLLGWLRLRGQGAGFYGAAMGTTIYAVANVLILVAVVWWTAAFLGRVDAELRQSEARFRGALDAMMEGCQIVGRDWRYLYVNDAAAAQGRRSRDRLLGRTMMECYPGIEGTALFASLRRCLETCVADTLENEFGYPDGSKARFVLSIQPIREGVFILSLDVTERRRAEEELRAARNRLQHLLASSPSVLYSLRVGGEGLAATWVSDNILAFLGYTEAEALAPNWWLERVHPDDRDAAVAGGATLFERGQVARDYRFRHSRGHDIWIRDEQRLLRDEAGRPAEIVGSWFDITERKQAEQRLAESEEQYRLLFDSNPHPMWVYDEETLVFLAVNDAALHRYGWTRDEFLRMTIKEVRPLEDVPALLAVLEQHRSDRRQVPLGSSGVWIHTRKDGARIEVEMAASPILFRGRRAWLTLIADVTEKRHLEARLQQAQKMEAVGQLAGGIAHDFNNLVGVIMGYSELLRTDLQSQDPAQRRVEQIQKATERAATLTRQLLAFSRRQVLQPTVLDLNEALRDIERMLRRLIGEDIEFVTRYSEDLGHVKVDQGQLDQVIVNLAVNARDAMPSGGKLIVETVDADLDETYARSRLDVLAGPYVMLAISDTGHGMSAETQARLFEPFFTTKAPEKGTGLGLATVQGIVKQSGGHIAVYSEPGRGTTFRVYLPRVEEPITAQPVVVQPSLVHGSETVLVVEDADALRTIIGEILAADGYAVLTAPDPIQALEHARAHEGVIHCLLTDVVMPHMSGRELAARLRLDRSALKVVFMSGYADEAIGQHGILEAGIPFIQKPFTTRALLQKLREVLG